MFAQKKEWIINGVLLLVIAGMATLMALESQKRRIKLSEQADPKSEKNKTENNGAGETGSGLPTFETETNYDRETGVATIAQRKREKDPYPNLGDLNLFRDLVTPTPTPPPRTPTPQPTPSLIHAVNDLEFQYPIRSRNTYVFLNKKTKKEIWFKEGEPVTLKDPKTRQDIVVEVQGKGRYGCILTGEGQVKEYSLK